MNPITQVSFCRFVGLRLAIVLACLMFSSQIFAQCSTDAWVGVTGTPLALGNTTNPVGKKYEQVCGLTIDAESVPAYVTTDTPVDETEISARFYLLQELLDLQSGDLSLLKARDGGTVEFELLIRSTGIVNHLVSVYRDNGSLVEDSEIIALQNVWQAIEVAWTAGAGDGTFEIKIDDISMLSVASLTNGGAVVNEIDFGVMNSPVASGELVLDAIEVRRAGSSGLLDINELRNISTRADVLTQDEIVIGGFIINGDTDKCVVVRGRGPSVNAPEGVTRLPDPYLVLRTGDGPFASNDNWMDSPEAEIIIDLGLNPSSELDAAIYACLPPGPYTAMVRGVGGVTGVGIVEVNDTDVGTPYLRNISTRARVDTNDLVAIAGFIIDGSMPKQVLIRARGPTVNAPDGVVLLSDPTLTLRNSNQQVVMQNDNWGDAPNATEISETGLAPSDPGESAILMELDPGSYTAIIRGVGGTTGVGIVEVNDLSGGSVAPQ
jgi:hypothetical protein